MKPAVRACVRDLIAAPAADFGKGAIEVHLTALLPVYREVGIATRRSRRWMRGGWIAPGLTMLGTSARILPEPKGGTVRVRARRMAGLLRGWHPFRRCPRISRQGHG